MNITLPVGAALDAARACLARGDGVEAVAVLEDALPAAPDNAALLTGLGVALRFAGQIDAAASSFARALERAPDQADAQVYLGMIRLAQDRQQEGWRLYQARWRNVHWTEKLRYPEATRWDGRVSPGLRLLLWAEQGFGDCIQFARYAPWLLRLLRQHGGSLVLEVPAPLLRLLQASWPFLEIVSSHDVRGRFDAHLPLMDLPNCCGGVVGPGGLPYEPMPSPYLSALPDLRTRERGVLRVPAPQGRTLSVGVAWQGRPSHPDDRLRSVPQQQLAALFAVPGIRWVSLQKDGAPRPPWLPDDLALCLDFSDTARVVSGLDLVISIDSALAHLAGALGKPVWLLLPKIADWRWRLTGETSPWYPSMRLFRQGADEDWAALAARVAVALVALRGEAQSG